MRKKVLLLVLAPTPLLGKASSPRHCIKTLSRDGSVEWARAPPKSSKHTHGTPRTGPNNTSASPAGPNYRTRNAADGLTIHTLASPRTLTHPDALVPTSSRTHSGPRLVGLAARLASSGPRKKGGARGGLPLGRGADQLLRVALRRWMEGSSVPITCKSLESTGVVFRFWTSSVSSFRPDLL